MSQPNRIQEKRKAKGLTLQALATEVGTTKGQIDKLEKGQRRLTVEWMVRLSKPLDCDPRDLLALAPQNTTPPTAPVEIPVFGLYQESGATQHKLAAEPIDRTPCIPCLARVPGAYALYVPDSSMAPMYRVGQLAYINPHKPAKQGAGIVLIRQDGGACLAELADKTQTHIVIRTLNPEPRTETLPLGEIRAIHIIIATQEPS